ncbi:hypothetical protein JAAARDRAFT_58405 [Jaapia argillacea MUCL 33604]|uniref:Uncharacterized protein n=1 Tax=Jaapia argillacea MUCL 33604 TaxID=933084 RepID=A0A067PVE3_9AGAM|nr:hypothetical protein JAAARDRAFT_58405 [Jaapia argillacea MUCL 33604]
MALPMLVNGADCGPINPLQGLAKRMDGDRGVQQDYFGAGRAGSSREGFRTQTSPTTNFSQETAQFFSGNHSQSQQVAGPSAFDLSVLRGALPLHAGQAHATPQVQAPLAGWASDFMSQQPQLTQQSSRIMSSKSEVQERRDMVQASPVTPIQQGPMQWTPPISGYHMSPMSAYPPAMGMQVQQQLQQPAFQADPSLWDREFDSQASRLAETSSLEKQEPVRTHQELNREEADELARTAGLLVETLKDEQNPKFKNSAFLGLMHQLRDRNVVVEGNEMVERSGGSAEGWASDFAADVKGKGKAREGEGIEMGASHATAPQWSDSAHISSNQMNVNPTYGNILGAPDAGYRAEVQMGMQEDPNEAYFKQDNADYMAYWRSQEAAQNAEQNLAGVRDAQRHEWDGLQRDWDNFEATASGIRPIANYQFQVNNPYMLGESSRTRNHLAHMERPESFYESVLELEAIVQRNAQDHLAWYDLGVKQQENEREQKAIEALTRALELDPTHLPSWLALSISHTNEGHREHAYEAIKQWVGRNDRYRPAVDQYRAQNPENPSAVLSERFRDLTQCLITMARSDLSGQIDADIQVALAVLLNTNEEYDKAHDCFRTALAVRPDDWLLYNRAGATLANNGRADEALDFYYRALELNPAYIRARFNLGISCINLRRYDEAAHHILDALVLQDSDSVRNPGGADDKRGVTSSALWESLKTTCLHMQRIDLATLCDHQDLDGMCQRLRGFKN